LRDYTNPTEVKIVIRELCDEICRRARTDGMQGRTIHLGVGYSKETLTGGFSHSVTIENPTYFEDEVYQACLKLFNQYYQHGVSVRNVYVSLTNLSSDSEYQLVCLIITHGRENKA
jgi:DNA polymerase V